jgi:GPH family glycoside/pentoside/hexuronide:cation symporter
VVFALWAGLALGGAVAGWLLGAYGVVSDAPTQTATAQAGIVLTGGVYAGLAFLAAAVFLFLYPLSSEKINSIARELTERRKSFAKGV